MTMQQTVRPASANTVSLSPAAWSGSRHSWNVWQGTGGSPGLWWLPCRFSTGSWHPVDAPRTVERVPGPGRHRTGSARRHVIVVVAATSVVAVIGMVQGFVSGLATTVDSGPGL